MLKYIEEVPFFCFAPVKHLELALSQQNYRPGRTVLSAGFCLFGPDGVTLHGESDSLGKSPRPEDKALLEVFSRITLPTGWPGKTAA
jgi:hypothetical protein